MPERYLLRGTRTQDERVFQRSIQIHPFEKLAVFENKINANHIDPLCGEHSKVECISIP